MYVPGGKFYPFFDEPGTFVTSVDLLILRDDGFYWDFNDSSFKDSGWTTKIQALTEKTEGVWVWATGWTIPSGNREYRALYKDNAGALYPGERILASLPTGFSSDVVQTGDSFARLGAAGAGLTAVPWNATWDAEVQSEATDALNAYDPPTGAELVSEINAVQADIAALNNLSAAAVNAEVVDALATDTYAEPGQGAPAATTSIAAKINYLYKAFRNLKRQTATLWELLNDAGTVVDQKSTVSDDGTTATKTEVVGGP